MTLVKFVESKNLKPEDMPDILTRIFKIKLDSLISRLKEEVFLGEVDGGINLKYHYSLSFGIPHCHICLFLEKKSKLPNPEDCIIRC
uniref:Uncharacterized protein n=1 Tax=Lactuca sativa TaxID=4236 RepID=A0A9R1UWC1_LACSA|nr:hypothetical protein LSAT_V11C800411850 [Lactuca sativa]